MFKNAIPKSKPEEFKLKINRLSKQIQKTSLKNFHIYTANKIG